MPRSAPEPAAWRRAREICLAYPDVSETGSWGHPNFRTRRRIFVALEPWHERPTICFRLEAERVQELLRERQFFATPYGRGLWVSRFADDRVPWRLIRTLIDESYQLTK